MKKYLINYENYSGKVNTTTIEAWDEESAKEQLINCKEIYWIKPIKSQIIEDYRDKLGDFPERGDN
jgi:hypothetical protein